jgi:putative copper resistance protein D
LPDPLILARAVHIGATLLACGTAIFAVLAATPLAAAGVGAAGFDRSCDRLIRWSLAVAVLSGAAWLAFVAAAIVGQPVPDTFRHGGFLSVAGGTRFGLVCLLRLALALLFASLTFLPAARGWRAAIGCAFAALIAWCGHAGATPGTAGDIHLTADIVHLVAASAWLGALPALALLLATARRHDDPPWRVVAVHVTARFSRLGAACVALLLATGIIASVNLLSGPRDLIDTSYGRLLALKIALFLGMVAIATVNHFRLTPRLPQTDAIAALVHNCMAELVLGIGIVAAVGALGAMEPGGHAAHHAAGGIPEGAAFVHLHMPEVMADITINPGRRGRSRAILRVMREDATLYPTNTVEFALDPPGAKPDSPPRRTRRAADGTWTVENIPLGRAGVWTVRVIVDTGATAPAVLDGPIIIEP